MASEPRPWKLCPTCGGVGRRRYEEQGKLCLTHGGGFAGVGCTCEPCPTCAAYWRGVDEAVLPWAKAVLEMARWHGYMGESTLEEWERIAAEFQRDSGMLRPGKDQPGAMGGSPSEEQRRKAFAAWCDNRTAYLTELVRAVLPTIPKEDTNE